MTNKRVSSDKTYNPYVTSSPSSGFYTYALVDSIDNDLFYIGKGKGSRMFEHVREWNLGIISNVAKFNRIGQIISCGASVKYLILHQSDDEQEAYNTEASMIALIGTENLTNISGKESRQMRDRAAARESLARLMSYDEWVQTAECKMLSLVTRVFGDLRAFHAKVVPEYQLLVNYG